MREVELSIGLVDVGCCDSARLKIENLSMMRKEL